MDICILFLVVRGQCYSMLTIIHRLDVPTRNSANRHPGQRLGAQQVTVLVLHRKLHEKLHGNLHGYHARKTARKTARILFDNESAQILT